MSLGGRNLTVHDGYELTPAVAPGMTKRPIVVDFDDTGNLYVAESSGTNDDVQKQLANKPHSILKLTDTDGDGVFDRRTVFADRMMFPEGTLWHAGSLYVAAPPQIWKLTDTDADGVADKREVWFDAKTLTGCANDLHGPYLGPDGWIYWCKGAFAEQTYHHEEASPFVTKAAHIFRRHPAGGPIEPVMTGGMDNPVEVAFSASGERFFTTTFFQHPANGLRDGLVHAIYGGVYGKPHGVLDGHPRTGDLMPVMTHLGAAAPSGLARLESDALGAQDHLVSACFNLHNVQLHELVPNGSTFSTNDRLLLSSDDIDFHPTDVIEDADGSLLVVDTGGWYKLCCPTSQLHKPEVLGTIYRLRKTNAQGHAHPWGRPIDWDAVLSSADPSETCPLLSDTRFMVRRQAVHRFSQLGTRALPTIKQALVEHDVVARRNAVWCACRIDDEQARELVRLALRDSEPSVRQAAVHAVSLRRDRAAVRQVESLLHDESASVRRAAAEALGRIGDRRTVEHVLAALGKTPDRVLEHSLIYALIETNFPSEVRKGFESSSPVVVRAALRAIGGMEDAELTQTEICRFLAMEDVTGRDTQEVRRIVTPIAKENPQWGASYASVLTSRERNEATAELACALANCEDVRDLIREWLLSTDPSSDFKIGLLRCLPRGEFQEVGQSIIARLLADESKEVVAAAVQRISQESEIPRLLRQPLRTIAQSSEADIATRLAAIQCLRTVDDQTFRFANSLLLTSDSVQHRNLAAVALGKLELTTGQLATFAEAHHSVGPLELGRTIAVFESQTDPQLGQLLFTALVKNPVAEAIPVDQLTKLSAQFGPAVRALAEPLLAKLDVTAEEKAEHIDRLLAELPAGNIKQGHHVFHNKTAACFACHALGYRGGRVGPDLSRIARIRSRRDLLEAIVYPSASFVRSYEPFSVLTKAGIQVNGVVRDQTDQETILQCNATEIKSIRNEEIDSMTPSRISIMPAGIEKQLSRQELADLLAFLESRK